MDVYKQRTSANVAPLSPDFVLEYFRPDKVKSSGLFGQDMLSRGGCCQAAQTFKDLHEHIADGTFPMDHSEHCNP